VLVVVDELEQAQEHEDLVRKPPGTGSKAPPLTARRNKIAGERRAVGVRKGTLGKPCV
jgi:hypothetical protein